MTCFYCKGNVQPATTTYMTDYNGCYIIIKKLLKTVSIDDASAHMIKSFFVASCIMQ